MERKIGEIFEYDGEWYQCADWDINPRSKCDFNGKGICSDEFPCTSSQRKDKKNVFFKKLEKVGEPYTYNRKTWQLYKSPIPIDGIPSNLTYNIVRYDFIEIEIKQNQENMEKKKDELEKITSAYVNGKITYGEYEEKIEKYYKSKYGKESMEEKKLDLKEFDLEAAKLGKPVCTRDGRKARIICFDMKGDICPMVAAVEENGVEYLYRYDEKGLNCYKKSNEDLMMLPEKHEGWINIVKTEAGGYCCRGAEVHSDYNDAILENINVLDKRGIIVKIEWEE